MLVFSILPAIVLVGAPLSNFFHPVSISIVLGTMMGGILLSHSPGEVAHGVRVYLSRAPGDAAQNSATTRLLTSLASLSMTGGLLGLLIGLVGLFRNLEDPTHIGPGMAGALLPLFYGIVLSEFVFRPAAAERAQRSAQSPSSRSPELS